MGRISTVPFLALVTNATERRYLERRLQAMQTSAA
jgi:hypothetical protein